MTQQPGPHQLPKKEAPITVLELLDVIGRIYELRETANEVSQQMNGPSPGRDRELKCIEMICDIVHTVSLDKEGYIDLLKSVQRRHPRWVPASRRPPVVDEDKATEE